MLGTAEQSRCALLQACVTLTATTRATNEPAANTSGKRLVQRLVDEVINRGDWAGLSELCTPHLEPKLKKAFVEFKDAFPDWHQEIVELVEEGSTVVARFRCTGTQHAEWQGIPARGGRMRIDEVYFFRVADGRLSGLWGLEDTWTRRRQLAGERAGLGELGSLS